MENQRMEAVIEKNQMEIEHQKTAISEMCMAMHTDPQLIESRLKDKIIEMSKRRKITQVEGESIQEIASKIVPLNIRRDLGRIIFSLICISLIQVTTSTPYTVSQQLNPAEYSHKIYNNSNEVIMELVSSVPKVYGYICNGRLQKGTLETCSLNDKTWFLVVTTLILSTCMLLLPLIWVGKRK